MNIRSISRKIAIVGTARAGKTVFLTSLINHLEEHHKNDFIVGKGSGVQISDFKRMKVAKGIGGKFNYGACRDALVYGWEWPKKTKDTSHFICDFKRSDWRLMRNELHFFDLPGERFADVAIARYENFSKWSDNMLEYFTSDTLYRKIAADYLTLQEEGAGQINNADDILNAYRKALAQFVLNFKPIISPSTFMLDQDGNTPTSVSAAGFIEEAMQRTLGLPPLKDKTREFAPLSEKVRKKHPEIKDAFSHSYKQYRQKVVLPLLADLKSSKRLIILIDIPSLLNGGVAMYNDNREILENLFAVLEPDSWFWRIMQLGTDKSPVKIDRIAFVATKSDLVYPIDVEEGYLMDLLRQMTEKFAYTLDDVEVEWFTCSAVASAKKADSNHMMRGSLVGSNDESNEENIFEVSKLPNRWPNSWKPGDFQFPSVLPKVPENRGLAPEQHNLDKVFSFITRD